MPRAGYTTTPCPGCGERNERKKDKVCPSCFELMETGRKHREAYDNTLLIEDTVEINLPYSWCRPRYSAYKTNPHSDWYEVMGKAIVKLADMLAVQKGVKVSWGYMRYIDNRLVFEPLNRGREVPSLFKGKNNFDQYETYDHSKACLMSREAYETLESLHEAIEMCLAETEEKAVDYGKDALRLLNNGDITMDQFLAK